MIDLRAFELLELDAAAVRENLPHRPPLLLVDGVTAIASKPPALKAFKHVSADEPVFAGHFPGEPVWPGAYCLEGLAQTCALLGRLKGHRGQALLAAADVKLTAPVLPGQRLDYLVVLGFTADEVHRFDVEAAVGGRVVAKGTLTLAQVRR